VAAYQTDPVALDLLSKLAAQSSQDSPYTLLQGVIRHKGRMWLGSNKPI